MTEYWLFEEWCGFDGGGMYVHEFETEKALSDWCVKNKGDLGNCTIIKGGKKVKPKINEIEVIKSYIFETQNSDNK